MTKNKTKLKETFESAWNTTFFLENHLDQIDKCQDVVGKHQIAVDLVAHQTLAAYHHGVGHNQKQHEGLEVGGDSEFLQGDLDRRVSPPCLDALHLH